MSSPARRHNPLALMSYFDVVVLGGGPAGCAVALSLKREAPDLSVAILEKSGYAVPRIGETLPPNIDVLLSRLGIWRRFLESGPMEAYGTRACWGSAEPVENEFIFQKEGRGWHLDRRAFDRMFASEAVRAGAQLFSNARLSTHQRAGKAWNLSVHQEGGELPMECRFVVDATGRNSSFAVQQGAKHIECDRLAGSFLFFTVPKYVADGHGSDGSRDSYTLVEAFEYGWTYCAALPGGGLVASVLSDVDILRRLDLRSAANWLAVLDHTPETRSRLRGADPRRAPFVRSASSRRLDVVAGDGWIAAGDAASAFDPLSSQGIYKAIRGGICASYAIRDALSGTDWGRYQRFVYDEYSEYLDIRAGYYAREQRWPEAPFWRRRHERITLDPAQLIQACPDAPSRSGSHLTVREIDWIREVCRQPCPAHRVVREILARSNRHVPQRRIVIALQELLELGVVRTMS